MQASHGTAKKASSTIPRSHGSIHRCGSTVVVFIGLSARMLFACWVPWFRERLLPRRPGGGWAVADMESRELPQPQTSEPRRIRRRLRLAICLKSIKGIGKHLQLARPVPCDLWGGWLDAGECQLHLARLPGGSPGKAKQREFLKSDTVLDTIPAQPKTHRKMRAQYKNDRPSQR